jgi:PII-like signaling protein
MEPILRRKLEILVDAPLVRRVISRLDQEGVTGYTVFSAHGGSGRTGAWGQEPVSDATAKMMVMAVMSPERAARVIERLSPYLDELGLVVFASTIEVVRAHRYD